MRSTDRLEMVERVREALDVAAEVDARRIDVVLHGDRIVLRGWVASPDEAAAAQYVADSTLGTPEPVVNDIGIDPGLREGADDVRPHEDASPAENEILVGDTDMLAGESGLTSDSAVAFSEDQPWDPPESPVFPADTSDQRGFRETGVTRLDDDDADLVVLEASDDVPSAPDLTREELARARSGMDLPSLDPDANPQRREGDPDPIGVSSFGMAPDDETEASRFPEPVSGTAKGPGAVGEHATGGGSAGSVAATETGARGVDTRSLDPARSATGATAEVAGTHRGPEAREDEAIREDLGTKDPS